MHVVCVLYSSPCIVSGPLRCKRHGCKGHRFVPSQNTRFGVLTVSSDEMFTNDRSDVLVVARRGALNRLNRLTSRTLQPSNAMVNTRDHRFRSLVDDGSFEQS
jgi:hypothetical protein